MDDDAQLARDLLLARRLKLAVRLVIYPLLLGGVLIAWHVRHARADNNAAPKVHLGVVRAFSGDRAFGQTEDDQLRWLQVTAVERCDNGQSFSYRLRFPRGTITQRANAATAVALPLHGADDRGATVDYGRTVATVTVGISQLDVRIAGSLVWMPASGGVARCTATGITQTLVATGA